MPILSDPGHLDVFPVSFLGLVEHSLQLLIAHGRLLCRIRIELRCVGVNPWLTLRLHLRNAGLVVHDVADGARLGGFPLCCRDGVFGDGLGGCLLFRGLHRFVGCRCYPFRCRPNGVNLPCFLEETRR